MVLIGCRASQFYNSIEMTFIDDHGDNTMALVPLTPIEVIVAVGVAVWAGTTALLNGANVINERRDVVLVGKLKDEPLTPEHRRVILYSDWLPMTLGIGVLSLGAIAALIILPCVFMNGEWYASGLSFVGLLMFVVFGSFHVFGSVAEFRMMKRVLKEAGELKPRG